MKSDFRSFSVFHLISSDRSDELAEIAPYTATQKRKAGKPTLYICEHFACEQPINEVEEMLKKLAE